MELACTASEAVKGVISWHKDASTVEELANQLVITPVGFTYYLAILQSVTTWGGKIAVKSR